MSFDSLEESRGVYEDVRLIFFDSAIRLNLDFPLASLFIPDCLQDFGIEVDMLV